MWNVHLVMSWSDYVWTGLGIALVILSIVLLVRHTIRGGQGGAKGPNARK